MATLFPILVIFNFSNSQKGYNATVSAVDLECQKAHKNNIFLVLNN